MGDLNFGAIAAVGVGILIYAAISLVVQVEQAFNVICGAPSGRRLVSRLVNYWTLLTLGSVALYLSFTLSGRFAAILGEMPAWLDWATLPVQLAVKVGVTWLLLMFAYLQMPNTRVRLRPAAIGAIVAACLWEIAKSGLTWFVSNATEGKVSVYGSLALLPIFLLWIYVTWLIVLFGLELASILQTLRNASILDRRLTPRRQAPTILDASVALQALAEMARGFREGRATRLDDLAAKLGMSEEQAAMLATAAVNAGLVHAIERELEPDIFALARPAETIKLRDAFAVLDRLSPAPLDESAKAALRELRDRQRAPLMDLTLASLIEDPPASNGGAA
jgi:membrane protein